MKTKKLIFNKKYRAVMKQRLTKRVPMPAWVLVLFAGVGIIALGLSINALVQSESKNAVNAYKESEYIKTTSLHDVQDYALKTAWYKTAQLAPFIVLILSIGVAIGVGHGVALVRVDK